MAGREDPQALTVRTSPSGQALLTIVRAYGPDIPAYWNQLKTTIRFTTSMPIDELTRLGAQETERLRKLPLDQLLADREEQWHLFINQADSQHSGWSHIEWTRGQLAAEVEVRLRSGGGQYMRGTSKWTASPDWNRHHADREIIHSTRSTAPKSTSCRVEVRGDSISLAATQEGKHLEQWKRTAPENYIPGALLPHLLGNLSVSAQSPMIIQTDSFPTFSTIAPEGLLTLIIRSAQNAATQSAKSNGPPAPDSRTVTVEINGSGKVSRWRFGSDGSVQSITLPDSIERIESSESAIRRDFARDPQMMP